MRPPLEIGKKYRFFSVHTKTDEGVVEALISGDHVSRLLFWSDAVRYVKITGRDFPMALVHFGKWELITTRR